MSDIPPIEESAATAGAAFDNTKAQAKQAAAEIDAAFASAGASLAKSLAKAASDGKISLAELASAVISAVDAGAGQSGSLGAAVGKLGGLLGGALGNVFNALVGLPNVGSARADGGGVAAGQSYLVGERGPEVFRPSVSGDISAPSAGGVVVNVQVAGGAAALLRSEAQVASALARAVAVGARR